MTCRATAWRGPGCMCTEPRTTARLLSWCLESCSGLLAGANQTPWCALRHRRYLMAPFRSCGHCSTRDSSPFRTHYCLRWPGLETASLDVSRCVVPAGQQPHAPPPPPPPPPLPCLHTHLGSQHLLHHIQRLLHAQHPRPCGQHFRLRHPVPGAQLAARGQRQGQVWMSKGKGREGGSAWAGGTFGHAV